MQNIGMNATHMIDGRREPDGGRHEAQRDREAVGRGRGRDADDDVLGHPQGTGLQALGARAIPRRSSPRTSPERVPRSPSLTLLADERAGLRAIGHTRTAIARKGRWAWADVPSRHMQRPPGRRPGGRVRGAGGRGGWGYGAVEVRHEAGVAVRLPHADADVLVPGVLDVPPVAAVGRLLGLEGAVAGQHGLVGARQVPAADVLAPRVAPVARVARDARWDRRGGRRRRSRSSSPRSARPRRCRRCA